MERSSGIEKNRNVATEKNKVKDKDSRYFGRESNFLQDDGDL